jgi:hypothetical protein
LNMLRRTDELITNTKKAVSNVMDIKVISEHRIPEYMLPNDEVSFRSFTSFLELTFFKLEQNRLGRHITQGKIGIY